VYHFYEFRLFFAENTFNRLLNRDDIFEKKLVRPEYGESPVVPPVPGISIPVLFLDRVWPEWKVDRDGTFLGKCLVVDLIAGVIFDSVETTFVFSVEEVFS